MPVFEYTLVVALQTEEKSRIPKLRVADKCQAAFCLLCHFLIGNLHSPADFQLISAKVSGDCSTVCRQARGQDTHITVHAASWRCCEQQTSRQGTYGA